MAAKRVLLINPNRYRQPPVIPIGLEYLASALEDKGHKVSILDLCFDDSPIDDTITRIQEFRPDVLCVTVRNVDTVLYPDTEYFLPDVAALISKTRSALHVPVIIGGAGIKADPEGILGALDADLALIGPAESVLPDIIGTLPLLPEKRIIRCEPGFSSPRSRTHVDYKPYIKNGGIAGFETHKGCSSSCPYCIESRTSVGFRDKDDVVADIRFLHEAGADHLHLCDSEFNEDDTYCMDILRAIYSGAPEFKWTLYMKPGKSPEEMFPLLAKTGAYHITLSVDTLKRNAQYIGNACRIVTLAADAGIKTSIDLLGGFPGEEPSAIQVTTEDLLDSGAEEVVVNTVLRLYRGLPITETILNSPEHSRLIIGDTDMLKPCFYFHISPGKARELLGNDPRIKIAGEQKGVNYERA